MSEYIPKPDPEGINAPIEKSPLLDAGILVGGFIVIALVLFWTLGFVAEKVLAKIPIEKEIKFFEKINALNSDKKRSDASLEPLLNKVSTSLKFPVSLRIQCSKEMNAFAFPGGQIIITSELIKNIKTENGLMFVIGHELGHFANRDHLQGLGRQVLFSAVTAMLGVGGGIEQLSNVGSFASRKFQQSQEINADEFGLNLLENVYGHLNDADEFFNIISAKESKLESVLASFASTHPSSEERIRIINQRKEKTGVEARKISSIILTEDFKNSIKCIEGNKE